MSKQYDDNNRGSLWPVGKANSGKGQINGTEYRFAMLRTGVAKPSHELYITRGITDAAIRVAIFREEGADQKRIAGGSVSIGDVDYWVNVYTVKSENPKAPALNLEFRPKEQKRSFRADDVDIEAQGALHVDDDIPFAPDPLLSF